MKRKSIKNKILEYFYLNPTKSLRVRQIEREVKVPLPSAIHYAKELNEETILSKNVIGEVVFYRAGRTSLKFLIGKKLFNIKSLYESGLIKHLIMEYNNPAIVIFGSYSRGEDTEESDIDLYIEHPKKIRSIEEFEKKLKRKIQIFNFKKISDIKNKELANNIINGVTLNGFLEVFK